MPQPVRKTGGGRPPKFDGPSRPITVTLPENTLEGLLLIDQDRGQAIVKLTAGALRQDAPESPLVQVVEVSKNKGLIFVGKSKALQKIPFLHLVEVSPGRFLLALDPGNDFKTLEIGVQDMLDVTPPEDQYEIKLMSQLLVEIRKQRKSSRASMAEIVLIDLEKK